MIPREILKKIRQIELRTNRLVTETVAGAYHSVFKGQGMEFDEVREYQPGDDVRAIDWNVTARMNHPYVKKYVEERELTVMLVVDVSGSGLFGSRAQSKRELAAEIASVLAFSAIRNNDKVGLILFTDGVEKYIAPRKGRRHVLRVIREVLFFEPARRGTDIATALQFLMRVVRRRAIVVVISDFIEPEMFKHFTLGSDFGFHQERPGRADSLAARGASGPLAPRTYTALRQSNRRHDVVAVQITDPHEFGLPEVGRIVLEDAETGEVVELNTGSAAVRAQFAAQQGSLFERLAHQLRAAEVDVVQLRTDRPYIVELNRFFAARERRRARG
ncbi:MAG: DUF58 domain-containing protein [Verrucomicrobiae bacterium]|nr:DUF58 domain-containing protein [Verrucomicrobiae bacterium]